MTKALELLNASLEPPKYELKELDWKAALSSQKQRLGARNQRSVLSYDSDTAMTKKSLRDWLNMPEKHPSMVSGLTVEATDKTRTSRQKQLLYE